MIRHMELQCITLCSNDLYCATGHHSFSHADTFPLRRTLVLSIHQGSPSTIAPPPQIPFNHALHNHLLQLPAPPGRVKGSSTVTASRNASPKSLSSFPHPPPRHPAPLLLPHLSC